MLTSIEMNGIKGAISMAKTGGPSSFVMRCRLFAIAHSDAYQSWSIRKGYEGTEIFTVMAEYIDEDTLSKVFADFLEYYLGKTGCYFYPPKTAQTTYTPYKYAQPSYYSASTHYISLEERVKRLEKRTDNNERSRDHLMKELAQRKNLEEKLEKTFDKIYDIVEEWEEEDWPEDRDKYWMNSIKNALDELEED